VSDKDVFFAKSLEHFLEWFSQSEIERASKARLWMTGFQTQLVWSSAADIQKGVGRFRSQ
jgi:hypothetical protein